MITYLLDLHDKNDKTHLIHRPIDICATSPLRLIKGTLSFLLLGHSIVRDFFNECAVLQTK